MDFLTLILWIVTAAAFTMSLVKDRDRTLNSMKMAKSMMKNMIGQIMSILLLIGLLLTFIPPETIKAVMGSSNALMSTTISALVGSITLIPAFVAFPLVGSLVDKGATIMPAAAFLTTLTMVGAATFPLEKREFGTRFTLVRNGLSFLFAITIALLMGVII